MSDLGHQFVLGKQNAKGKSSITYKFNLKGQRFVYGTGQIIIPELWDKETQRPTTNKKLLDQVQRDFPQIKTELKNINQRLENITAATLTFFSLKEQQKAALNLRNSKNIWIMSLDQRQQSQRKPTGSPRDAHKPHLLRI
jgi:hypothetical protein